MVYGLGFRVRGLVCRVLGFTVFTSGLRIKRENHLGFAVQGFGFRI